MHDSNISTGRTGASGGDADLLVCCVCVAPIPSTARADAMCWADPGGQTCVAHTDCLRRLGEFELRLGVE